MSIYHLFQTSPFPIRQLSNLFYLGPDAARLGLTGWHWFILSVICYFWAKSHNCAIGTSNVRANFSRAAMSAIDLLGDRAYSLQESDCLT
ncbi:hypothetical protein IQ270_20270 [Microcoleus sp. LEGE 07076]|uniref:hypothetical protein n=1 Tax=Microcoleus sp. LEGE 07076 TaxID=915322 RepID=UPI00187F6502|nr:hypothetical protein [Microcoleus sp. LEGE 07076]MBE9186928.1 hypothetical protein [Microcoleus sp. LEGE 07076]